MMKSNKSAGRTGASPVKPGASPGAEDRLEKLESHLTFLERQYDDLNKVVIEQGRALTRFQTELARASEALRSAEIERIRANNQKPPHYQ
jgi:uncharacterized coiled-coil protein SlyX